MYAVQANDPRLIEITELANHILRAVNSFEPSDRRVSVDALTLILGEIVRSDEGLTPDRVVEILRKACEPIERSMN